MGVPLGSVLGYLSFIIYINDIAYIDRDLSPVIFAYDTIFIFKADNILSLENLIYSNIIKINNRFINNKLYLNIKKTNHLIFNNCNDEQLDICIVNNVIVHIDYVKLGTLITN